MPAVKINRVAGFIFLISRLICNGQTLAVGGSLNFGYKSIYDGQGLGGCLRIKKHLDINAGFCHGAYNGYGYYSGLRIIPFDIKWQPYIGLQYNKSFGTELDFGGDSDPAYYRTRPMEFYSTELGIIRRFHFEEEGESYQMIKNTILLIGFGVSYRHTPYQNYVEYLSGGDPTKYTERVKRIAGSGIGVSLSAALLFYKSK